MNTTLFPTFPGCCICFWCRTCCDDHSFGWELRMETWYVSDRKEHCLEEAGQPSHVQKHCLEEARQPVQRSENSRPCLKDARQPSCVPPLATLPRSGTTHRTKLKRKSQLQLEEVRQQSHIQTFTSQPRQPSHFQKLATVTQKKARHEETGGWLVTMASRMNCHPSLHALVPV